VLPDASISPDFRARLELYRRSEFGQDGTLPQSALALTSKQASTVPTKTIEFLVEYIGLFGVLALFLFVPVSKTVTGGTLTIIGAFFPARFLKGVTGNGSIRILGNEVSFGGSLRLAVVVSGIVTLIFAGIETNSNIASARAAFAGDVVDAQTNNIADAAFFGAAADDKTRQKYFNSTVIKANPNIYSALYIRRCVPMLNVSDPSGDLAPLKPLCQLIRDAVIAASGSPVYPSAAAQPAGGSSK
jgi:hypothetical protein